MPAVPDGAPAIALEGVHKHFLQGARQVDALAGLDVAVADGRITGLLGPDGAGKTTLMRLAAGLLLPDAGTVRVLGRDTREAAAAIQADIGYMPQRFGLYEDLTVRENLDLYANLQGLDAQARRTRFDELLALTALGPFGHRRAGDLSGGMKQKLGLACALLRTPRLLLLDEPTVGVDPISRQELWNIVQSLREHRVTVLVSTAYLDEAEYCDNIILLHDGTLLAQDAPDAFKAPLAGHGYRVRAGDMPRRVLQARLQARDGVLDAVVEADDVRVVLTGTEALAVQGETWTPSPPRFEDAFVSLLRDSIEPEDAAPATPDRAQSGRTPPGTAADDGAPVIRVQGLRRFFGDFEAVKGIDFEVRRGEVFGLLGANGAGKSTTFRMLCGLLPASAGTLEVAGADLRTAPASARGRIGYVSQRFALYAQLTVAQNLRFFASAYGLRGARRRERLAWALSDFRLGDRADVNAGTLPLGYRQRLALACALMHEPSILFLDEPTSGVDPLTRRAFWQRINRVAAEGVTVLVTTHFMDEAEYCDRLVLMSLGEILASGSPSAIRAQAGDADHPSPSMQEAFIRLVREHEASTRRAA